MNDSKPSAGKLYLVPTPIGNLEDMTLRGIRILKEVDLIAAEDTRHTRKLLTHLGITTRLISYYREKEQQRSEALLELLEQGKNIALVSDAGTPGISDPGSVVVRKAHEKGFTIVPLPGPSALTTCLSASGLEDSEFFFGGFLPQKSGQRRKLLQSLSDHEHAMVFYESVHRIDAMLRDALQILGDRQAFWARELSKTHEELLKAPLSVLAEKATKDKQRGEFVIVIWPAERVLPSPEFIEQRLIHYRDTSSMSVRDVTRKLSREMNISRNEIYNLAVKLWKQKTRC